MENRIVSPQESVEIRYNPRFGRFLKLFLTINTHEKLFPKECRTCGRKFTSLTNYLWSTVAKGHCLEDAEPVMRRPYTMSYRHCACGNTLILTLTEEIYPSLRDLWTVLRQEAERTGRPLNDVVSEFADQWQLFMVRRGRVSGPGE
ncbi:MAG: hypothetical protein FJY85_02560 [Deltaproteobacteria bacterium]|nr:hypothetical protein [Deltaproteobacteria bacterium]